MGFTAREEDDWVDWMSTLIENEQLRKDNGLIAYNDVKQKFNLDDISKDYYRLLESKIRGEKHGSPDSIGYAYQS